MKLENLAYVGFRGKGWYSGAIKFEGILCRRDKAEELFDILRDEWMMSDLDGKHSEVRCVPVCLTDKNDVLGAIVNTPYFEFSECEMFDFSKVEEEEEDSIRGFAETSCVFIQSLKITPVTTYKIEDPEGGE